MEKMCENCLEEIPESRKNKRWVKFCSNLCSREFARKRYRKFNPRPKVSTSTMGAMSELRVAIDLMSKGFDVYRAISGGAPCDLAILKNKKLLRVEVKTGYLTGAKVVAHPPVKHEIDVLAIVMQDKIIYKPSDF